MLEKLINGIIYYIYVIRISTCGTFGIFADKWNFRSNRFKDLPLMTGRIAIVTGGSRGIGLHIVRKLLLCDMEVIVACRNCIAGKEAVRQLRTSGIKHGIARVFELDNSSLKSVHNFANKFKEQYSRLDILINNAGIFWLDCYTETKDRFECQYQINYLSHFLLTALLISPLKAAGTPERCSRVINMSSIVNLIAEINFADVNYKNDPRRHYMGYSQSKLALLLFTKTLARLTSAKNLPIKTHAVHPGIIDSDLFDNFYVLIVKIFKRLVYRSPSDGATSAIYAAVSPEIENKSGLYIQHCKEEPAKSYALNLSVQTRLFNLSLKQLHMTDFFQYA